MWQTKWLPLEWQRQTIFIINTIVFHVNQTTPLIFQGKHENQLPVYVFFCSSEIQRVKSFEEWIIKNSVMDIKGMKGTYSIFSHKKIEKNINKKNQGSLKRTENIHSHSLYFYHHKYSTVVKLDVSCQFSIHSSIYLYQVLILLIGSIWAGTTQGFIAGS